LAHPRARPLGWTLPIIAVMAIFRKPGKSLNCLGRKAGSYIKNI